MAVKKDFQLPDYFYWWEALGGINNGRVRRDFQAQDTYEIYLQMLALATGASAVNANNFFVDGTYGNDGTAQANNLDKMYQTINAAGVAAAAKFALTGVRQVVYVYAGVYTAPNMYRDGVIYYFQPGTTVNTTGISFSNAVAGRVCEVYGSADFVGTSGVVDVSEGTFYMEANDLTSNTSGAFHGGVIRNSGSAITEVHCHDITSTLQKCIVMFNSTASARLYVTAHDIQTFSLGGGVNGRETIHMPEFMAPYEGKARIVANKIFSSPNGSGETNVIRVDNDAVGTAELDIEAAELVALSPSYAPTFVSPSGVINSDGTRNVILRVKANINSPTQIGIGVTNGFFSGGVGNAKLFFEGQMNCAEQPVYATGSFFYGANGMEVYINSELMTSNNAVEVMHIERSPRSQISGKLIANSLTGVGVKKYAAAAVSPTIFDTCKIITGGAACVESTTLLDTYKVIFTLARNTANLNAANSIVGSNDYLDANIE